MAQAEVIRVIRYRGTPEALAYALGKSLPDGLKDCVNYTIEVATHSSTLPPLAGVTSEEVAIALGDEDAT